MIRRLSLAIGAASLTLALSTGSVLAGNPSGSGQPGANCEQETSMPAGFATGGFAHAGDVYAGSDGTHSLISNNPAAVSQYDVACFQVSTH